MIPETKYQTRVDFKFNQLLVKLERIAKVDIKYLNNYENINNIMLAHLGETYSSDDEEQLLGYLNAYDSVLNEALNLCA